MTTPKWMLGLLALAALAFAMPQQVEAQTLPYFAFGNNAQYNTVDGSYSGSGVGIPVGRHSVEGQVFVLPNALPYPPGVLFDGFIDPDPLKSNQTVSTFLGDIDMNVTGTVVIEEVEGGPYTGTWNLEFEITGGTGIYSNASGTLTGVATNPPPFEPLVNQVWDFNWYMVGSVNLNWF